MGTPIRRQDICNPFWEGRKEPCARRHIGTRFGEEKKEVSLRLRRQLMRLPTIFIIRALGLGFRHSLLHDAEDLEPGVLDGLCEVASQSDSKRLNHGLADDIVVRGNNAEALVLQTQPPM